MRLLIKPDAKKQTGKRCRDLLANLVSLLILTAAANGALVVPALAREQEPRKGGTTNFADSPDRGLATPPFGTWLRQEMLLAVAGLDKQAITERTQRLASGDWSTFSSAERAAFTFARKQATQPWALTSSDVEELIRHSGPDRTLDVIWWSCCCHYMTRVADAFQLPLERDNVFDGLSPPKKEATKKS